MADQTKEALGFIARLLGGAAMRSMPLQTVQTVVKGGAFVPTPNKNPIRQERVSSIDIARALADDQLQPMDFDAGVVFVPNNPQNNAGFIDTPENRNAFIHQTPEEHEQALRSFLDKKNIPPEKAVQLGIKAEEALEALRAMYKGLVPPLREQAIRLREADFYGNAALRDVLKLLLP